MEIVGRSLKIELPKGQSAFLWGPRKTGKSTLLGSLFQKSIVYDFLKTDLLLDFSKRPSLLREQLMAQPVAMLDYPVILEEVQKVPQILDEVQYLIENRKIQFILCGSSARKLKRGQANLLGGRAWRYELFPFTSQEIDDFDLLRALNHGMVPEHYLAGSHYLKSLKAYVYDYLKEEVFSEGLIRNIPAFSRFFEAMGYTHGELTNFSSIARDSGIDSKTVKEYYQILIDTLLGRYVLPYKRKQNRQIITKTPKFYLFDVGVAGILTGRSIFEPRGREFGRAFEHFILMELVAHSSYSELDYGICFWRTKTGLEVDFILGDGEIAIEVKGTDHVDNRHLRALRAFKEEYSPSKALVVSNEKQERIVEGVHILPWKIFLERLWNGKLIQ